MRIISGKYRGKNIVPPRGFSARPTTDMAKEALFNILENRYDMEQIAVLDLFAGTGSIGFEFASRGCPKVTSVEMDFVSARFINETAEKLGFPLKCIRANAFSFVKNCSQTFDVIFADPPYDLPGAEKIIDEIFSRNLLSDEGVMVYEHSKRLDFEQHPNFSEIRHYGKVQFSFFKNKL